MAMSTGVQYVMNWMDPDCGSPPGPLRAWVAPVDDPTGVYYVAGGGPARCGVTPITGAWVAAIVPAPPGYQANSSDATLDFGADPGSASAELVVTGQTGLLAATRPRVYIRPVDTVDHTADEHKVLAMDLTVATIVAGVGFTITGVLVAPGNTVGLWAIDWSWRN